MYYWLSNATLTLSPQTFQVVRSIKEDVSSYAIMYNIYATKLYNVSELKRPYDSMTHRTSLHNIWQPVSISSDRDVIISQLV